MSQSYETFIQFIFKKEHWDRALSYRGSIPPRLNHYHQCLEVIEQGIKPQTEYQQQVGTLICEIFVPMQLETEYYDCLEFFNLPYRAFEDGGWHYQSETHFDPRVSDKRKTANVLGQTGNYYLSHHQIRKLMNQPLSKIQDAFEEVLNPFKHYPDLIDIKHSIF